MGTKYDKRVKKSPKSDQMPPPHTIKREVDLKELPERANARNVKVKKTMSKCHIPERSHVTKPLLLSNDVVISPTEHAQQICQINQF